MYKTRWQYSIQLVCCFSMGILHFTSLGISTIFSIALCWLCSGVPSLAVSFESEASAPSPRVPLTWWRASKSWNLYTFWPWSAVEAAWLCSRHLTCAWWAGTSRQIPHWIDWPVSRNWWSLLYLFFGRPWRCKRAPDTQRPRVAPASTVVVRPHVGCMPQFILNSLSTFHHRFVVPALWILVHTKVIDETIMLRYTPSTNVMYSDHIKLVDTWQPFAPQIVERCVSAVSCFNCSVLEIILCQYSNTYLCWDFVLSITWSLNVQRTWLCNCLDSGRILGWLFLDLSSKDLQFGRLVVCSISSLHALFWCQCVTLSTHLAVPETTPSSPLLEHHVLHWPPQCADLHRLSDRITVSGTAAGFFLWRQAQVLIFPHITKCRRPLADLILGYHHLFRPSTLWIHCLCSGLDERSRLLSRWWPDSRHV